MGGWFKRTFHPSKCKREEEEKAEASRNAAAAQAAQQRVAAELRKQQAFEAIKVAFDEAREKVESWYTSELSQAEEDYAKKQADYLQTLEELSQAVGQARSNIESGFCEQQFKVFENQKEAEHKLEACRNEIIKQADKAKEYYGQNKVALDNLWQQVESSLLHKECQDSYLALKQSEHETSKSRHYSRLMAYLRHLSEQDFLTRADFERYTQFLDSLYHSRGELEKDKNFNSIDNEINLLFSRAKNNDCYLVADAYKADRDVVKQTYADSKGFNEALSIKLNRAQEEVSVRHAQAMKGLLEEKAKKLSVITDNYEKIQLDIEAEKKLYQEKYDAYLFALSNDRDTYCSELENNENQERNRVDEQYEAELAYIQDAVNKAIDEINSTLSQRLKQLKNSRFSTIVNFCTAIVAGVGAYFTNTVLAGAGPWVIDAVETTLGLTSVGAAANLFNDKDAVGFRISASLSVPSTSANIKPFRTNDEVSDNQSMGDMHVNLKKIREQFDGLSKRIEEWQSQAEDHLFYSIKRNVKQPKLDFSQLMTVFFNQNNNQNNLFNVQLGALDTGGSRTVRWNFGYGGNAGWAVMPDLHVRTLLKRMTGVNDEVFRNDWKQPQMFSFDRTAFKKIKDRMSQEEYLTFSGAGATIGLGGQALHDEINGDDWLKMGVGVAKGMAMNAGIHALSQVPKVAGLVRGAGVIGATVLAAQGIQMAVEFETNNFMLTEEYRDIMQSGLPEELKNQITRDAYERQAQARAEAKDLKQRFKENPGAFGLIFGIGLAFRNLESGLLCANPFKTRNPFAPPSIKGRLKGAELPIEGKIRFVPRPDYHPSMPLHKGVNGGYIDKFGNEWVKGPSRTAGETFEWDIQLSKAGKQKLGWASRDGQHLNVSLKGHVTHR